MSKFKINKLKNINIELNFKLSRAGQYKPKFQNQINKNNKLIQENKITYKSNKQKIYLELEIKNIIWNKIQSDYIEFKEFWDKGIKSKNNKIIELEFILNLIHYSYRIYEHRFNILNQIHDIYN